MTGNIIPLFETCTTCVGEGYLPRPERPWQEERCEACGGLGSRPVRCLDCGKPATERDPETNDPTCAACGERARALVAADQRTKETP